MPAECRCGSFRPIFHWSENMRRLMMSARKANKVVHIFAAFDLIQSTCMLPFALKQVA